MDLFSLADRKVLQTRSAVASTQTAMARVNFDPHPGQGVQAARDGESCGGRSSAKADDAVAVRSTGPELADASVRTELLAELARVTGGRACQLPLGRCRTSAARPAAGRGGSNRTRPAVWDRWGWLLALAALLGTEWLLRRALRLHLSGG